MIVQINLLTDDGQLIARREGDAMNPLNFRTIQELPLEDKRFKLFGYSYQPITVLKPLEPTR